MCGLPASHIHQHVQFLKMNSSQSSPHLSTKLYGVYDRDITSPQAEGRLPFSGSVSPSFGMKRKVA